MRSWKAIASAAAAIVVAALVSAALGGCGKPPPAGLVTVLPPECEVLPAPLAAPDTITVALFERVAPEFAPWGRNGSENLVFRHLYETLITLDCAGRVDGGLAASWRSEDDGCRWVFELRDGARFSDGSPVTAADVVTSWADALLLDTGIDSVEAHGGRRVLVYFREPSGDVPLILSAPPFSVARKETGVRWPLGSGRYRIAFEGEASGENGGPGGTGRTITAAPVRSRRAPMIRFVESSAVDARDLLEGPVDLMVTEDPNVIEYASGDPRFVVAPLDWDRTYALLSAARVREIASGDPTSFLPRDFLEVLSRDAVRGDARGSEGPRWWEADRVCRDFAGGWRVPGGPVNSGPPSDSRRILYDADDPTARDLAERIVALAAAEPVHSREAAALASAVPGLVGGSPAVVAQGIGERDFDWSLRAGDEAAYIVSIPCRPALPCDEIGRLFDHVPWIAALGPRFSTALVPLVDTRSAAIARRERLGMVRDWYGIFVATDRRGEED